jgi:hypothetical protein
MALVFVNFDASGNMSGNANSKHWLMPASVESGVVSSLAARPAWRQMRSTMK